MEADPKQSLSEELLAMAEVDQAMRNAAQEGADWDGDIDKTNTSRMKEIVALEGWPAISNVGNKASVAAWLLVQHADADPAFQEHCLNLMKDLPAGEVSLHNQAYLEDRVRVNTGRAQLYGTQFHGEGDTLAPRPIENPSQLDTRRASVGLGPFSEYEKLIWEINHRHQEALQTKTNKHA